jgi:hypothetical protein
MNIYILIWIINARDLNRGVFFVPRDIYRRSQWPRGIRRELSSPTQTLGS